MTMQAHDLKYRFNTCWLLVAAIFLLQGIWTSQVYAIEPKQQFFRAENAATALLKNKRHQKYRDKWLACIDNYRKVYRLAPNGPWAAAGLYRAGVLYLELYKRSYLKADQQEGVDLLQRVIQRFPKSRYTPKAKSRLAKLKQPVTPPSHRASAKALKQAHAAYKKLVASPAKQKYRDQWEKGIKGFEKAYDRAPKGPHAPEALYMQGVTVQGLADVSRRDADYARARKIFKNVISRHPKSGYAGKAKTRLEKMGAAPAKAPAGSNDPLADIIARNKAAAARKGSVTSNRPNGMVTVEGLRFWSNPSYTRIVIDANRETSFSHRLLKKDPSIKKPQRLYIDLTRSRLGRDLQKFIPINDELLSDARAGQYTKDSVRIVVDIKSFKTYKIFSLKNPFRIVLDVWGDDSRTTVAKKGQGPVIPPSGKLSTGAIARQLALGVKRIVIDPGHGGRDHGAPGYLKGVHEKTVVLQIAKRLARKVEKELNCEAVLTRTGDRFLTLEERTAIANTQNADLFISIHTNAVRDKRAYGIETYFLNLATDDDAILVAARENATSTKNISDLQTILNDLMQNAKISESSRLAAMVQQETVRHLKKKFSHIRNKGVKQAPFYVLLGAQMPALLVETSFISNPRECKRLTSAKYQEQLCDGIIRGIRKYIKETSPTALKQPARRRADNG